MAGLPSGEGSTMIDSVVLAQYINVTDIFGRQNGCNLPICAVSL